jgi:hypothetical protein
MSGSLSGVTRDLPATDYLARAVECPAEAENSYSSEEFLLPREVREAGGCVPEGLLATGPNAWFLSYYDKHKVKILEDVRWKMLLTF